MSETSTDSPGLGAPIGIVETAEGAVFVVRAEGARVALRAGDAVHQGDRMETGEDGALALVLADGGTFALDANGSMVMDEMVYDPSTGVGSAVISVVEGIFVFISGRIAKTQPDAMVVSTPVMEIGIRGTRIAGRAAAEGEDNVVTLLEEEGGYIGEITVLTEGGIQVLNQVNQTTMVSSSLQAPPPPLVLSVDQVRNLYGEILVTSSPRGEGEDDRTDALPDLDMTPAGSKEEDGSGEQRAEAADEAPGDMGHEVAPLPPSDPLAFPFGPAPGPLAGFMPPFSLAIGGAPLSPYEAGPTIQSVDRGPERRDDDTQSDPTGGIDTILGDEGDNVLTGSDGPDRMAGGGGNDVLHGLAGNDWMSGGTGNDHLYGGQGGDRMIGDAGNDHLLGGAGEDHIDGDVGDDWIAGGTGSDMMRGGDGNDIFYYHHAGEGTYLATDGTLGSGVTIDLIDDFQSGIDAFRFDAVAFGMTKGAPTDYVDFLLVHGEYDGTNSGGVSGPHFVFDGTGTLYYDDDGYSEGYTVIANLQEGATVAASDIYFV